MRRGKKFPQNYRAKRRGGGADSPPGLLGLTLFPLGYFEDLSPLGGGWFGPPPSDLGN